MRAHTWMAALAVGCLALGAGAGRLEAQAAPAPGGVTTEQFLYDIYVSDPPQKVGKMRLKTIAVKDVVILEQEFQAPMGAACRRPYRPSGRRSRHPCCP